MSKLLDPVENLDFSRGRITKYSVSPLLTPLNSVSQSLNVDFSEVIGSAIVRKGNERLVTVAYNGKNGENQLSFTGSVDVYDVNWLAQTFTVQSGSNNQIGVLISAKKTGSPGPLIIQIRNTVAGSPGSTILATASIPAAEVSTGFGQVTAIFLPTTGTLTTSSVYSIVISSPTSPDVGNSYQVRYNSAGGYGGGSKYVSTNSGSSWTISTGEDLFFLLYVQDTSADYNQKPLGFQAGKVNSNDYGVVVYTTEVNNKVVLFYADTSSTWKVSNLQNLTANAMNRFAVLNGALFRVSSGRAMDYSTDRGLTWQPGSANQITITQNSVIPSLIWVNKNRMLASGYSAFPSRVYFSSIVDPNDSNFITWDTDPDLGNWIDINPDDGGNVTGFSDTSNLLLVFKNNAMYRLNTINKTVDSENIFNVGAVSQEAIVKCLGLTYFYSGNGIYRTDGGFPEMISRLGVQDLVDNIGEFQASAVTAGTDGLNVYFSIGDITLKVDDENKQTISRVVLKFSPRDESWSVFNYKYRLSGFSNYRLGQVDQQDWNAQYNGDIGRINYQGVDNQFNAEYTEAIIYNLESQELDMGNRSHTKTISDKVAVYTKAGTEGMLLMKANGKDFKPVVESLNQRVSVGSNVNLTGEFFTYRWQGEARGARPILQGVYIPTVTDLGLVKG